MKKKHLVCSFLFIALFLACKKKENLTLPTAPYTSGITGLYTVSGTEYFTFAAAGDTENNIVSGNCVITAANDSVIYVDNSVTLYDYLYLDTLYLLSVDQQAKTYTYARKTITPVDTIVYNSISHTAFQHQIGHKSTPGFFWDIKLNLVQN